MVDFRTSDHRHFIFWNFAARRGRLFFRDEHVDYIRDDVTIGKRQPEEIRGDQETASGVEREEESPCPVTLTRS